MTAHVDSKGLLEQILELNRQELARYFAKDFESANRIKSARELAQRELERITSTDKEIQ